MKTTEKMKIINLLKRNDFERQDTNHYVNKYFSVELTEKDIAIAFSDGYELFAPLSYFSMLGMLAYLNISHTGELKVKA